MVEEYNVFTPNFKKDPGNSPLTLGQNKSKNEPELVVHTPTNKTKSVESFQEWDDYKGSISDERFSGVAQQSVEKKLKLPDYSNVSNSSRTSKFIQSITESKSAKTPSSQNLSTKKSFA